MKKHVLKHIAAFSALVLMTGCGSVIETSLSVQDSGLSPKSVVLDSAMEEMTTEADLLTEEQKNSIALLNYLSFVSQEINSTSNKLYLEEYYDSLFNDIRLDKIDKTSKTYYDKLFSIIQKYQTTDTAKKRLEYIYEQDKANKIKNCLPDVSALMTDSAFKAAEEDVVGIVMTLLSGIAEFYNNYQEYDAVIIQNYLQNVWELNETDAATLHESRIAAFDYMWNIVKENSLPENMALSEEAVKSLVECKNNSNSAQRLQFLESPQHQEIYQNFGEYWILLAECYFQNGNYEKCLDAASAYESLDINIFKKDYSFARILPCCIASAYKLYTEEEFISFAENYLTIMLDNIREDDWESRYFAAQTYADLYSKTQDTAYLEKAYRLIADNIPLLAPKQIQLNQIYVCDIQEAVTERTDEQYIKKIETYNKILKEKRKTELPSIYEPLALNCDFLFALAHKLSLPQEEQEHIESMLQNNDDSLFLTLPTANCYSFHKKAITVTANFEKGKLTLPVACVSENSVITASVSDGTEINDWIIEKVERPSDNFSSFTVTYTSQAAMAYTWHENDAITLEISDSTHLENDPIRIKFIVCNYKENWLLPATFDFVQTTAT